MLSKKDRRQLLEALDSLVNALEEITNKIVRTSGGTELTQQVLAKIQDAKIRIKSLSR